MPRLSRLPFGSVAPQSRLVVVNPVSTYSGLLTGRRSALPGFQGTPSYLCRALRPRHAARPCHYGHARSLPLLRPGKLHGSRLLSWFYHTASAPAAYASRFGFPYTGKAGFRLPGKLYRTGFVLPAGFLSPISVVSPASRFRVAQSDFSRMRVKQGSLITKYLRDYSQTSYLLTSPTTSLRAVLILARHNLNHNPLWGRRLRLRLKLRLGFLWDANVVRINDF